MEKKEELGESSVKKVVFNKISKIEEKNEIEN